MRQAMTRLLRKSRPALEGLEGRALLDAGLNHAAAQALPTGVQDRQISYTTAQGAHVLVTIFGAGSIGASAFEPDGALNLVFSGTNSATGIVARVSGGTGRAPLQSIENANLAPGDLSGIGASALNVVNLKNFDLVDGGRINLTGGVHSLFLNSVGRNTQINLRTLPATLTPSTGAPQSFTSEGVTLTYSNGAGGAQTLTSVSGQFVAGTNIAAQPVTIGNPALTGVNPGVPPAPPGAVAVINHINGAPRNPATLSDPQIFGYDPVANTLIRFDAATGAALQTIPLTGMGTMTTGVSLGRDNGRLVALVGNGTTIFAFDAVTGAPAGSFSIDSLAANGITAVDGLGSTDTATVLTDSTAGPDGTAQIIDLTASLATGHAVAVGPPFSPQRQFQLAGGLTGLPASRTLYATGAAHFDPAQPDMTQFGILKLDTTGGQLSEVGRTALPAQPSGFQDVGPSGTPPPKEGLGSVDRNLALVTGVANGHNTVTLYNPQSLAKVGTIALDDPNLLADLSGSFRPDLVDAALIDVQGDVQSLRADDAQGLFFNDAGNLNLVKITRASNSVIIGEPFGHAAIAHRTNVAIFTTSRTIGDRNGVTIVPGLSPIGPLSLPS